MEIRKRNKPNRAEEQKDRHRYKTISGTFLKFIGIFSVNTFVLLLLVYILLNCMIMAGWVLPANQMEKELKQKEESIEKAHVVTEDIVPAGSSYGVYGSTGEYLYGNFASKDREEAWDYYKKMMIYPGGGGYYRFIARENGELCIVKYYIATRFNCGSLGRRLPSPEIFMILLYLILFLVQTILLARYFGKYMRSRLATLNQVTEKIRNQDLDFGREHSDLKEIEEVLTSLYQMKTALEGSLEQQWNIERQKNEQIAALAHDIKTPLTIIRGNAELLQESSLSKTEAEYNEDILQSIATIEEYLMMLNDILDTERSMALETTETISCEQLADRFEEQARKQILAGQRQLTVQRDPLYGNVVCSPSQVIRAWNNILSNAVDYTLPDGTIRVDIAIAEDREGRSFAAAVTDQGPGFTSQDLKHAGEQFYQGDKSRHTRTHYGLGLHIASQFAKVQGGHLTLENTHDHHAKVTLYLRMNEEKEDV